MAGASKTASPLAAILVALIKAYRAIFSPFLRLFGACRFHPSCSQYGMEAISKYGAAKGGWMAIKRILRCNPFFPGGYDPVT